MIEAAGRRVEGRGQRQDRVEIERRLHDVGEPVEKLVECGVLARLHQAEMALGQRQRRVAQDGADHRHADRGDGVGGQAPMPLAADAVEHDAGDADAGIVAGKALATAAAVCDWPETSSTSRTGRRSRRARSAAAPDAAGLARNAVEQAHGALDDHQVGAAGRFGGERVEQGGGIAQLSRLKPGRAGRGGVEAGIDVVGAGFGAAHRDAAAREGARAAPSVTLVLPEPERGAPMMRPRARHARSCASTAAASKLGAHRHDVADDDQRRARRSSRRRRVGDAWPASRPACARPASSPP